MRGGWDYPLNEPRNPWSSKSSKGPFQCGPWKDDTIFKHGLAYELTGRELVHADKGHRNHPCAHLTSHSGTRGLIRGRHESVNKRCKDFKVLSTKFRHPIKRHGGLFLTAGTVIQFSSLAMHLFSEVDYKESSFLHYCLNHGTLYVGHCLLLEKLLVAGAGYVCR